MIKLFASDLDGTLLNAAHQVDDVIVDAVDAVLAAGKHFAVSTGRGIKEIPTEHDFTKRNIHYVCLNGALVMDSKHNVVYQQAISPMFIKALLETFPEYVFEFHDATTSYTNVSEKQALRNMLKMERFQNMNADTSKLMMYFFREEQVFSTPVEDILTKSIYKINCPSEVVEGKLMAFLKEHDEVENQPSGEWFYELTAAGVSKAHGIMQLAKLWNVQKEEIAVFGDGKNDVSMLRAFANSYAPANAVLEAKEVATYHIESNVIYSVPKQIKALLEEE